MTAGDLVTHTIIATGPILSCTTLSFHIVIDVGILDTALTDTDIDLNIQCIDISKEPHQMAVRSHARPPDTLFILCLLSASLSLNLFVCQSVPLSVHPTWCPLLLPTPSPLPSPPLSLPPLLTIHKFTPSTQHLRTIKALKLI